MHIKTLTLIWLALFAMQTSPVAVAQDTAGGVGQVVIITPRDGQDDALEKAITGYHHFVGDKQGALRWQWFDIITGENTGNYLARTGGHNWADFDAEHEWQAAAREKFASDVSPLIADARSAYSVREPAWGMWPENMEGFNLFNVTHWYVHNGQEGAFRAGMAKIQAAMDQGDFSGQAAFEWIVSGGHGNDLVFVTPHKSFADMAPPQPGFMEVLAGAMGGPEAAAKFMEDFGATFKVGESYLLRYRPDLSDYGDE